MARKCKTNPAEELAQDSKAMEDAPSVAETAKKTKAPKTIAEDVYIQFEGSEWSISDLKEKAVAAYVAEGHQRGRIKNLSLYVKPEERKIYYVVNDKATGSVDIE